MSSAEKQQVVAELSERLGGAKCLYLTDFTGLDVASITELRRRLSSANVEYVVVKNTLARRALAGGPFAPLVEHLSGPNAFVLSREDTVTAAKILTEFAKERERPRIKGGAIEGEVVSIDEIRRIAALPPREQLLAEFIGHARAPIAGLIYTLHGLLAKFVRTVDALRVRREETASASSEENPGQTPEGSAQTGAEA